MRNIFYLFVPFLFFGCTLKKELAEASISEKITVTIDCNITGDNNPVDYYLILLKDTINLPNQTPLYSGHSFNFPVSGDSLEKGLWIMIKKWVSQDSVFESKPYFISVNCPENTLEANLKYDISVTKRKMTYHLKKFELKEVSMNNTSSWDPTILDDAVSGSKPDIYFKINEFYSSKFDIDQNLKPGTYLFDNTLIPGYPSTLVFSIYDYDFNVSADDLITNITFNINPVSGYQSPTVMDNGLSRIYTIDQYTYTNYYIRSILTFKTY